MATPLAYLTTVRKEVDSNADDVAKNSTAPPPAVADPTAFVQRAPETPYQSVNPTSAPRLKQDLKAQPVTPSEFGPMLPDTGFRDAVQTRINDGIGTLGVAVAESKVSSGRASMPIYDSLNPVAANGGEFGALYFAADDVNITPPNAINGPQFTSASDALAAAQATQASRKANLPVPYDVLGSTHG